MAEIAELLHRGIGQATISLCHRQDLDAGSIYFIDVASKLWSGLIIRIEACESESKCSAAVEGETGIAEPGMALKSAWACLRAGDPWGCERLLVRFDPSDLGESGHHAMATALVALDRPAEAESHFLAWIEAADLVGAARAKYGLAMLYARFHEKERRSDRHAAAILDGALTDLALARTADVNLDTTFDEVFNRNGYALLEFRRGKVQSALELLRSGLARLPDTSERNHLHRSVLLYNMAQVYRRIGKNAEAVDVYEQVLALDPNMPEYHCELAMSLLALGRESDALRAVQVALSLDPYIPESHALMGFIFTRCGQAAQAACSYSRADELTRTLRSAYECAFAVAAIGDHSRVLSLLDRWDISEMSPRDAGNFCALRAEAYIGLGLLGEATAELRAALELFPGDDRIARNLAEVLKLESLRQTPPWKSSDASGCQRVGDQRDARAASTLSRASWGD